VFQNYALFPHMNVFQNVAYPLKLRGLSKDETTRRVMDTLDLVELRELASRRVHQLSGGQRQRVALARAVVSLGGTDARLWRYENIPAYVYGPCPTGMGSFDENVPIEDFLHVVRTHVLSAYDYLMAG
jgi:hypothetical protein